MCDLLAGARHTDDCCDRDDIERELVQVGQRCQRLGRELAEAKALLKIARCPNCDGAGFTKKYFRDGDGTFEWVSGQCQWCDERNEALQPQGGEVQGE